jgi:hypothetical protein
MDFPEQFLSELRTSMITHTNGERKVKDVGTASWIPDLVARIHNKEEVEAE